MKSWHSLNLCVDKVDANFDLHNSVCQHDVGQACLPMVLPSVMWSDQPLNYLLYQVVAEISDEEWAAWMFTTKDAKSMPQVPP